MGCHAVMRRTVRKFGCGRHWERKSPFLVRVGGSPISSFSHQPHLSAGLNCESCHGDVAGMDADQQVVRMDMGWCLDCHLKQPEENSARLTDCLACHQ
jgi:hypothetical protein